MSRSLRRWQAERSARTEEHRSKTARGIPRIRDALQALLQRTANLRLASVREVRKADRLRFMLKMVGEEDA